MRGLVWRGAVDLRNRELAFRIVSHCLEKDWGAEIEAIFAFVRDQIRYTLDPHGWEVLQGPRVTLALGYGDCDDICILLATLLESMGHMCRFTALGFDGPDSFSHVIVECSGGAEMPWLALDATESNGAGWFPPGVTCAMYCPLSDEAEAASY